MFTLGEYEKKIKGGREKNSESVFILFDIYMDR